MTQTWANFDIISCKISGRDVDICGQKEKKSTKSTNCMCKIKLSHKMVQNDGLSNGSKHNVQNKRYTII